MVPALLAVALMGGAGAPKASSCPHPYFPFEEGLRLTYRAGRSTVVLSVSDVKPTSEALTATLSVKVGEREGEAQATCTKDGISTALGGLEALMLRSSGAQIKILASDGPMLPSESDLTAGKPWRHRLALQLEPADQKSALFKAILRTELVRESRVLGPDQVTAGGKKYAGLKIRSTTTAGTGQAGAERAVESSMWLAPGVGIVKISTGETVDLELLKIERPSK